MAFPMDSLYASLAQDLGVPVSDLPAPPTAPLTPRPQAPRTPIPKPRPLRRLSLPQQHLNPKIPEHLAGPSISIANSTTSSRAFRTFRSTSTSTSTSTTASTTLTTTTIPIPDSPRSTSSSSSSDSSSPPSTPSPPASPNPAHTLRHIPSPRRLTLRELRAKQSEACLQRAYETTTTAYLDGTLHGPPECAAVPPVPPVPPRSKLRELSWARRGSFGSFGGVGGGRSRSSSVGYDR